MKKELCVMKNNAKVIATILGIALITGVLTHLQPASVYAEPTEQGQASVANPTGVSLALDGTLKVYVAFDSSAVGELTINDLPVVLDEQLANQGSYECVYETNAKDFQHDIVIKQGSEVIKTLSVSNMIAYYKNATETESIARALECYCTAAEAYFTEGGVVTASTTSYESVINAIGKQEYSMGEHYYGSSLVLESGTLLRHYYTEQESGVTYSGEKDGNYYIDEMVPAHQYAAKGSYCVNDYIYRALTNNESTTNLKNICVALYEYGVAAEAYAKQQASVTVTPTACPTATPTPSPTITPNPNGGATAVSYTMTIAEICEYPGCAEIMLDAGLPIVGNTTLQNLTLYEACMMKGIDPEALEAALNNRDRK